MQSYATFTRHLLFAGIAAFGIAACGGGDDDADQSSMEDAQESAAETMEETGEAMEDTAEDMEESMEDEDGDY